jgi:uncharacterized protein (UPF0264 family)
MVLAAGVDIIDLKQPASGALGALPLDLVSQIVAMIDGKCPISATIGDLPMHPETVLNAAIALAATGVDYIKIGFFPGGDWPETIVKLSTLAQQNRALIAVLFADTPIDLAIVDSLKDAGFKGMMLDTMNKNNGAITQIMTQTDLAAFVRRAKSQQLLCGLAGSLRLKDIPALLIHQPDYLGFRGALCLQHKRTSALSQHALAEVKRAINAEQLLFAT